MAQALASTALVVYALVVVPYLVLQCMFAQRAYRQYRSRPAEPEVGDTFPSVDVVVPCFNEDPHVLEACLRSVTGQDYGGQLSVFVVDDGSTNLDELRAVYDRWSRRPDVQLIALEHNRGKRHAQITAIRMSGGDLVLSVDSDTTIAPDGVRALVAGMGDPAVGAAMGWMRAANASSTWLTRLIDLRYWVACNQERAAQSLFGSVLCCCGPFSIYRRSALELILDDYANQRFRNRRCTHGEDRYLTNLILRMRLRTAYVPDAIAWTLVPERIGPYLRQQLRWNRSTYRDTAGIAPYLRWFHPYLTLDVVAQTVAPLVLGLSVVCSVIGGLAAGAPPPVWWMGTVAAVAVLQCAYGVWRTRSPWFLLFACYGVVHLACLFPTRLYALCTLGDDRWGSRQSQPPASRARGEPAVAEERGKRFVHRQDRCPRQGANKMGNDAAAIFRRELAIEGEIWLPLPPAARR